MINTQRILHLACLGFVSLSLAASSVQAQKNKATILPYRDKKLPIEARIANLLQQMTLEEKVAQTTSYWLDKRKFMAKDGKIDQQKAEQYLKLGVGHIARPNENPHNLAVGFDVAKTIEVANSLQKILVEKTRLGIPAIMHEESLHGQQAVGATNFPVPLALGCSFDTTLMGEIYTAIAKEVRLRGGQQVLAPVLDLARDARWGRIEETLGEDPYLVSSLGSKIVKTYQGNSPYGQRIDSVHVASTLKHFGAHGQPEGGINVGPTYYDKRTLLNTFMPPFEKVVKECAPRNIMPCYNENAGIPAHANVWLLKDLLRDSWGFKGLITTDYMAFTDFAGVHKIVDAKDTLAMARLGFRAGIDIELPDPVAYPKLVRLIKEEGNNFPIAQLDTIVARILRLKFQLGLFDTPYTQLTKAQEVIGGTEHAQLAEKAAVNSMVLLKNNNKQLPLTIGNFKKLAVIGPNANTVHLGGYSSIPKAVVTPLAAIKRMVGDKTGSSVVYAEGVSIVDSGSWFNDPVRLTPSSVNQKKIAEAMAVAKSADQIVVFVGSHPAINREAWAKDHPGDLTNLELPGDQLTLIDSLAKLGKPITAFVLSGPPLALTNLEKKVGAIVNCFYLGQQTGSAVAKVLFGNISPSGKLSVSMPRSAGHIPCFYNYMPSARRNYALETPAPLYPFGFGLSYATFKLGKPKLSAAKIKSGESVQVSIEVSNTSNRYGAEVVQLYIRDVVSNLTRPVKELKAFTKAGLPSGQTQRIDFSIGTKELGYYTSDSKFEVEPGEFEIMVGTSSDDKDLQKLKLVVTD